MICAEKKKENLTVSMRLRASLELSLEVSSEEAFPRFTPLLWTVAAADFAPSTRTELQL
jgi:hypothetical protein